MNQVQTQPAPAGIHRTSAAIRVVAIAVLIAAVLAVSVRIVEEPDFVDRLTVVNQSTADVDIAVGPAGAAGWTPEGVAGAKGTTTFLGVVDQGEIWRLRLTSGGVTVRQRITRAQLADAGWRVTIPASTGDALERRAPTT
jgi:hypothetical protein